MGVEQLPHTYAFKWGQMMRYRTSCGTGLLWAGILAAAALTPAYADDCNHNGVPDESEFGVWTQRALLTDPNAGIDNYFGTFVALDGRLAAVASAAVSIEGDGGDDRVRIFHREPCADSNDECWTLEAVIDPPGAIGDTQWKQRIALDNGRLVIGSPSINAPGDGRAFVYVRDAGPPATWTLEAELTPDPNDPQRDWFGAAVALDGGHLAVSTGLFLGEVTNVYMFERAPGELVAWERVERLGPPNPTRLDFYGWSVALTGDQLLVAAPNRSTFPGRFGAVFAYTYLNDAWVLRDVLGNPVPYQTGFGERVAADGHLAAVAYISDPGFLNLLNAATIYRFDGEHWRQSADISAPDADQYWGTQLDVSRNRVVLSGIPEPPNYSDPTPITAAVHSYTYNDGFWEQEQAIDDPRLPGVTDDRFGQALALDGDYLLIGANLYDPPGGAEDQGGVYVYRFGGDCDGDGTLDECQIRAGAADDNDDGVLDACIVDCNRNGIDDLTEPDCNHNGVVDECDVDPNDPDGDGIVYPDCNGDRIPDGCDRQLATAPQTLLGSNTNFDDRFGVDLDATQDTLIVGSRTTSAYIFRNNGTTWIEESILRDPNAASVDLANAVAATDHWAAVGSRNKEGAPNGTGGVHVWRRVGANWTMEASLAIPDGFTDSLFGQALAMDGDRLLVGAAAASYLFEFDGGVWTLTTAFTDGPGDTVDLRGDLAVCGRNIYRRDMSGSWNLEATIPNPSADSVAFPHKVSTDGMRVLVTDHLIANDPNVAITGEAYLYSDAPGAWELETTLPSPLKVNDSYGVDAELDGDVAIVGARTIGWATNFGGAYVFRHSDGAWRFEQSFWHPTSALDSRFGSEFALVDHRVFAGAFIDNLAGDNAGAVYYYELFGDADADGTLDDCQRRGDLNGDGFVDAEDLTILLSQFGRPGFGDALGDVDLDGDVDSTDLSILLKHFGG